MDYQEAIKQSRCFGVAYDASVKECKMCEVGKLCRQKTEGIVVSSGAVDTPTTKKEKEKETEVASPSPRPTPKPAANATATGKSSKKKGSTKPEKEYTDDMPEFKPMQLDELITLANGRGLDTAFIDNYSDVKIKRMRLIMVLKQSYEK